MSVGAASSRPAPTSSRLRLAALGLLVGAAALVPPMWGLARTHEAVDALQFGLLAVVVPALIVLGAQWTRLGALVRPLVARIASGRPGGPQTTGVVALELVALVAWRLPPVIDAISRHHWLVVPEAVTLVAAGTLLWLLLVESPPVLGRETPLRRLCIATVVMWSIWIVAYVEEMAGGQWTAAFRHVPGHGLSAAADRQVATVVLFAIGACAFLPVVFFNLATWLGGEERRASWRHERAMPHGGLDRAGDL